MAKQISVSDEVYEMLSRMKGTKSFSEAIKSMAKKKTPNITQFAGILKERGKELDRWGAEIAEEREKNHGRKLDW